MIDLMDIVSGKLMKILTWIYADAQDKFDNHWYRCPYSFDDSFNLRRASECFVALKI
jgi:hypothetical protein